MEQLLKILNMKEDENTKILYNNLIRYIMKIKYILNIDKNIIIDSDNLDKEVNKIIIYIKNKSYNRFYYCRLIDFIYININNIFSNDKFNNVELSEEYKKIYYNKRYNDTIDSFKLTMVLENLDILKDKLNKLREIKPLYTFIDLKDDTTQINKIKTSFYNDGIYFGGNISLNHKYNMYKQKYYLF